jgi:hypothetical protein
MPLPPSRRINSQNPETIQCINDSLTFFMRSVVVFEKLQPPLVYFGLGCLNQLYHLRPISFEQSRFVRILPVIARRHFDLGKDQLAFD